MSADRDDLEARPRRPARRARTRDRGIAENLNDSVTAPLNSLPVPDGELSKRAIACGWDSESVLLAQLRHNLDHVRGQIAKLGTGNFGRRRSERALAWAIALAEEVLDRHVIAESITMAERFSANQQPR